MKPDCAYCQSLQAIFTGADEPPARIIERPKRAETIMAGKFVLTKLVNGQFHFHLQASNGEPILSSQRYDAKGGALNGIESVRVNAPHDDRYERKEASNGQPMFNLKSTNGQVIGTSETYSSVQARENGILSVKTNAPTAAVDDRT